MKEKRPVVAIIKRVKAEAKTHPADSVEKLERIVRQTPLPCLQVIALTAVASILAAQKQRYDAALVWLRIAELYRNVDNLRAIAFYERALRELVKHRSPVARAAWGAASLHRNMGHYGKGAWTIMRYVQRLNWNLHWELRGLSSEIHSFKMDDDEHITRGKHGSSKKGSGK